MSGSTSAVKLPVEGVSILIGTREGDKAGRPVRRHVRTVLRGDGGGWVRGWSQVGGLKATGRSVGAV